MGIQYGNDEVVCAAKLKEFERLRKEQEDLGHKLFASIVESIEKSGSVKLGIDLCKAVGVSFMEMAALLERGEQEDKH